MFASYQLGAVPGIMGLDCFSRPTVGSLESAPRAGRVGPLLRSSLGGYSWLGGSLVS